MRTFTLACIQMPVAEKRDANLERAGRHLEVAARRGADLALLPEIFTCPYRLDAFQPNAEPIPDGPTCAFLRAAARRHGMYLVGGSIPERVGDDFYNTATLWSPDGELLALHRKVHLFDVAIPGGLTFQESASLAAGDALTSVECELGRFGLGVCYDLRFPETFRAPRLPDADVLLLPGAFNTTTGPAHWEILLRARAIENTAFVAACSPTPPQGEGYPAWGHSMIIDPWGEIMTSAERSPAIITAVLDRERLEGVRSALPVLAQRRRDVYYSGPPE